MVYFVLAALCYEHGLTGWCIASCIFGTLNCLATIIRSVID